MKIKTAELTGTALDWAVAKIETLTENAGGFEVRDKKPMVLDGMWQQAGYSWDWSQGGPIIDREVHNLFKHNKPDKAQPDVWCAARYEPGRVATRVLNYDGPTPLIAAMRCFVASKLGEEVDVPDELLQS